MRLRSGGLSCFALCLFVSISPVPRYQGVTRNKLTEWFKDSITGEVYGLIHDTAKDEYRLEKHQQGNSLAIQKLTSDNLRQIDSATAKIPVQGARYPENLQKLVNR